MVTSNGSRPITSSYGNWIELKRHLIIDPQFLSRSDQAGSKNINKEFVDVTNKFAIG